jgi:hypothetical protein
MFDALAGTAAVEAKGGLPLLALELVIHVLDDPGAGGDAKGRAEKLRAELVMELTPEQIQSASARVTGETTLQAVQAVLRRKRDEHNHHHPAG